MMAQFDWLQFFDELGILYRTIGPNVSKGHVSIKCPFCGSSDPSEHMSVAVSGMGWRCWRNAEHAGVKPHKLLMALGLTPREADIAVGARAPVMFDDIANQVRNMLDAPKVEELPPQPLEVPKDFRLLTRSRASMPYLGYLAGRGLSLDAIAPVCPLLYAITGEFSGRIIFPVNDGRGRLMGWTGRAVGRSTLRYKDAGPIKSYLWRENRMTGHDADTLVVCEGPFDALKVSVLGRPVGITGTCVFTSFPSAVQITALILARESFRHVVAVFDQGNEAASLRLAEILPFVIPIMLPSGVKDPGALRDVSFIRAGLAGRGAERQNRGRGHHRSPKPQTAAGGH